MARKRKKTYKCEILNDPFTKEQQEDYDKIVCKTYATVLYREFGPEVIDHIIDKLKGA